MTHIAVLGAGVVGITTAWYLRQAGFDVTVIERESATGMQALFASGALSVGAMNPWANPKTPLATLKGFFEKMRRYCITCALIDHSVNGRYSSCVSAALNKRMPI